MMIEPQTDLTADDLLSQMGKNARDASRRLAQLSGTQRADAIRTIASGVRASMEALLATNADEVADAQDQPAARRDRLTLTPDRIEAAAAGLETVAEMEDPIGTSLSSWTRPNGLQIERVRVPIGVIGVIYEARPLVTLDAAALCLKAGNAVILRPGSDCFRTATALGQLMAQGLEEAGVPPAAVQVIPTTDRAAVGSLLAGADGGVDVVVPRGGRSLVERVQQEARVPVIGHLEGICHVYVDAAADIGMARDIIVNAKMRRPGICGAAETLLIDRAVLSTHLPPLAAALYEAGCTLRGDADVIALDGSIDPATEDDWRTEYLAPILAIKTVDGVDGALSHISTFSTGHTESIVTADDQTALRFLSEVDAAIVMHNASTQFADGGEFGMGAEIGIATGRLPPRGPVGAAELTSFNYRVRGTGQTRP